METIIGRLLTLLNSGGRWTAVTTTRAGKCRMSVETAPYGTGAIPLETMVRAGVVISLVCLIVTLLGYRLVLPLVF